MFIVESENQLFSLKPMNCPESTFIYRSDLRSYRDLPLRYSEFGRLHRNERSGTLSGLTRVRQFIQDDAHIYVRPDQLMDEIQALLAEVHEAYGWFGLKPRFSFATKPDKAIGDPALWERAERLTIEAFAASDISYVLKPKDGTFYAPKIDIYIDDALGREWQMATIQIDLTMLPERFDLTYIDESGSGCAPDRAPSRDLRLARAVHRDPGRALRGRVPALDRARSRPSSSRSRIGTPTRRGSSPPSSGRAACVSRWTPRTTGCRTRSGSPRSRRCRTCSSSATARSRHARSRHAPGTPRAGSSRTPSVGRACRPPGRGVAGAHGGLGPTRGGPRDCRSEGACAILPLRPDSGSPYVRAARNTFAHTKGIDHQSRPARQPDDPHPTGSGRR